MMSWLAVGVAAAGLCFLLYIAREITKRILRPKPERSREILDGIHNKVGEIRIWFLAIVSVYIVSRGLELPPKIDRIFDRVFDLSIVIQIALIADSLITRERIARIRGHQSNPVALNLVAFIVKVLLWITVLLVCLDNLGVQITALIAGLGVGGVAIALAVQNILGDLFASLTIALDKPFEVGDFVIVGDFLGTVERVGIKTTRIRSLSGEELIFSNADLLQSRIRNYKRMYERRINFQFGIIYETDPSKLERVNEIVRGLIEAQSKARFDRCHLKTLGSYALEYEVVYWMKTADFNTFMDTQQLILMGLIKAFAAEGFEFAYPTALELQRDLGPRREAPSVKPAT